MNSKLVKEATHSRYSPIDVTSMLPDNGGMQQDIQVELIQAKSQQPLGPEMHKFALQLFVATKVSPQQLLPVVLRSTPSVEECTWTVAPTFIAVRPWAFMIHCAPLPCRLVGFLLCGALVRSGADLCLWCHLTPARLQVARR